MCLKCKCSCVIAYFYPHKQGVHMGLVSVKIQRNYVMHKDIQR